MHGGEVDQWRRGNQPGRLLMRQLQQHNTMHCNQRLPTQGPPAAPPLSAAACSGAGIISHLTLLSSLPPLPPSLNTHRSSLSKSNGRPAAKGLVWLPIPVPGRGEGPGEGSRRRRRRRRHRRTTTTAAAAAASTPSARASTDGGRNSSSKVSAGVWDRQLDEEIEEGVRVTTCPIVVRLVAH
jgi:hypothetical protein